MKAYSTHIFGIASLVLGQSGDCPSTSEAIPKEYGRICFEFTIDDYITTAKQNNTQPCADFMGYTVLLHSVWALVYTLVSYRGQHARNHQIISI